MHAVTTLRGREHSRRRGGIVAGVAIALTLAAGVVGPTRAAAATTTYWFPGGASDDAGRANGSPTATFDATAPTGTTDSVQSGAPGAVPAPYWVGTAIPVGTYLTGTIHVVSWWASQNPESAVLGLDLDVKVYTDAAFSASGPSGTLLAQTDPNKPANFGTAGPTASQFAVDVDCAAWDASDHCTTPLGGFVGSNLVVVIAPHYTDGGQASQVHYNSTGAPSSFTVTPGTPPTPTPAPTPQPCTSTLCFSNPLVLPKSGQTGGFSDTCYNPCGEPSLAVSPADGTLYVSTPRTIVICCNTQASPVWKSTDNGDTWSDPIFPSGATNATTGGDTELAVDKRGTVYEGELWLGSDSIYSSSDTKSWTWSPASHDVLADREWFVYAPGEDALYGIYDGIKGLMVVKAPLGTPLGSATTEFFPQERIAVPEWVDCPGVLVGPCVAKPGQVPDQVNGVPVTSGATSPGRPSISPVDGTLYFPFPYQVAGKGIGIAETTDGLNFSYSFVQGAGRGVFGDTGNDFPVSAVDSAGRLYVAWVEDKGDGYNVYLASSGDKGATWTAPLEVSSGISKTAVFPNVVAGASGQVAVSWYGTDVKGDMNTMDPSVSWNVYAAEVTAAASTAPSVATGVVESGFHHGVICTMGAGCTGDGRKLLDFFDMKLDRSGNLGVVYTRDLGGSNTEIAYSHQVSGCPLAAANCGGPGADVAEFPVAATAPLAGGGLLGALLLLRRRRRAAPA
jgi:hypothetical protein